MMFFSNTRVINKTVQDVVDAFTGLQEQNLSIDCSSDPPLIGKCPFATNRCSGPSRRVLQHQSWRSSEDVDESSATFCLFHTELSISHMDATLCSACAWMRVGSTVCAPIISSPHSCRIVDFTVARCACWPRVRACPRIGHSMSHVVECACGQMIWYALSLNLP